MRTYLFLSVIILFDALGRTVNWGINFGSTKDSITVTFPINAIFYVAIALNILWIQALKK